MPSSVIKQAEEVLEEVLRMIREDYADPFPVLCETGRKRFVEEEERLRNQLKETVASESTRTSLRAWFGLPSLRASECLKDAQELYQRVKEDINAKLRTRFSGQSNPSLSFGYQRVSAPPADMRCSPIELGLSDVIAKSSVQNDYDFTPEINEAINSPLTTSSESTHQNRDSSGRRHRRSPPPPPPPRSRGTPSNSSHSSLETSSSSGSDVCRSSSVRRPPPPLPRSPRSSRTPRPPTNVRFPSPELSPLRPAFVDFVPSFTQDMNEFASSMQNNLSRQAQGGQRSGRSDHVTMTNCVEVSGSSHIAGITLNNGGTKNTGAVIHSTTIPPARLPRHVPPF